MAIGTTALYVHKAETITTYTGQGEANKSCLSAAAGALGGTRGAHFSLHHLRGKQSKKAIIPTYLLPHSFPDALTAKVRGGRVGFDSKQQRIQPLLLLNHPL